MNSDREAKLFSHVDVLQPLSFEELDWLLRRIPSIRVGRGQLFYTPARTTTRVFYLLLEGRIRVYKIVANRELTLDVFEGGTVFGEAAVFAGRSQGAYAQALEPSLIAVLTLDLFEHLVQNNPEVGVRMMELLGRRLHLYAQRMADIGLKEVPARLASLILRLCKSEGVVTGEGYKIPTHYTHEQLAAMVGARRVAVSRALGELRKTGAVATRGRIIYVEDVEALERVAAG